jgi:hypothetical protein
MPAAPADAPAPPTPRPIRRILTAFAAAALAGVAARSPGTAATPARSCTTGGSGKYWISGSHCAWC